jgi:lysophospholipase L1-like esterase
MTAATINLPAGQTSAVFLVSSGERVTTTGTGKIQYTLSGIVDINNNLANWIDWPNGATAGFDDAILAIYCRGVATTAMTINVGPSDTAIDGVVAKNGAYWASSRMAATADPVTGGVVGITDPATGGTIPFITKVPVVTVPAWQIATYGDSRANCGPSSGPDVSGGQLVTSIRTPAWLAAHLGDAEIFRNYGVSGDAAVAWNAVGRAEGKTFTDFNSCNAEAVFIQYGVNDAMAGTASATIIAALKGLVSECIRSGKRVIFEAINPVRAPATNAASTQVTIDAVNAGMQTWLTSFSLQAVFADTASALKSADGYANTTLYAADGIHFNQAGAYFAGKLVAAAARKLLARRPFTFLAPDAATPNLLNLVSPTAFISFEAGTASGQAISTGIDANGFYTEFTWTPATLVAGECRARLEFSANFQTATQPAYALAGNEVLQGGARVICDNGSGGAPNAYSVGLRHRFYTASLFRDWGIIPASGTLADLTEKLDVQMTIPKFINTTASVVANPASTTGYQLQVYVSSQTVGVAVRVRVYNAQLRRVGYGGVPMAQTVPASGSAYTNTTNGNQQVYVAGGTVSAITVNGVVTGQTSGMFVLGPGDTLTPTYTVTPTTFSSKNF